MWTTERNRTLTAREAEAELGLVTLGGDPAGVLLGGERRWIQVYGPGGYQWRPNPGDRVLVLKAGAEQESPCILGTVQQAAPLAPGEVQLSGSGTSIRLGATRVDLTGEITVNGQELKQYIEAVVTDLLNKEG